MEFRDVVEKRVSVRQFRKDPVAPADAGVSRDLPFCRGRGYDRAVAAGSLVLDNAHTVTLGRVVTVLRAWDPERIILFGSHARGDARPESDLDILVVLPDRQPATRATLIDMRVAIGAVPIDYDLLITSHSEYAWRREYVGAIEYPAHLEGVELYRA